MSDTSPTPKAQLGCGTLILIALIVAIFSQGGQREELRKIQNRLDRIEKRLVENKAAAGAPAPDISTQKESPAAEISHRPENPTLDANVPAAKESGAK